MCIVGISHNYTGQRAGARWLRESLIRDFHLCRCFFAGDSRCLRRLRVLRGLPACKLRLGVHARAPLNFNVDARWDGRAYLACTSKRDLHRSEFEVPAPRPPPVGCTPSTLLAPHANRGLALPGLMQLPSPTQLLGILNTRY